jgi:hypothetical protein
MTNQIAEKEFARTKQQNSQLPKKKNFIVVVFVSLLFLTLIISGYFAYMYNQSSKVNEDLKNYILNLNSTVFFEKVEFSFPKNWTYSYNDRLKSTQVFVSNNKNPEDEDYASLEITYLGENPYPEIITAKQYVETDYAFNQREEEKSGVFKVPGYTETYLRDASYIINNQNFSVAELNSLAEAWFVFLIMKDNQIYKIRTRSQINGENNKLFLKDNNDPIWQIIQTIKIEDQNLIE